MIDDNQSGAAMECGGTVIGTPRKREDEQAMSAQGVPASGAPPGGWADEMGSLIISGKVSFLFHYRRGWNDCIVFSAQFPRISRASQSVARRHVNS
jgi:hypothetical protein